ncbi:MAG: carbohydrate kinase family protein [Verrucomicrobiota bacterium]
MSNRYDSLLSLIPESTGRLSSLHATLGFDGTVDIICKAVEERQGRGRQFQAFDSIRAFGQRIVDADGKSALIEIVKEFEKIGGNGPIMANALAQSALSVDYIGPLGRPQPVPVYDSFAKKVQVHSIGDPAVTQALEFTNGKVMLATLMTYDEISPENIEAAVSRNSILKSVEKSDLVCLLNWSCLPGLESILSWLLETILPEVADTRPRFFFFDLADPSMRPIAELEKFLCLISRFESYGHAVLGMNLNETQFVCRALGLDAPAAGPDALCGALRQIRARLDLHLVLTHVAEFAVCDSPQGQVVVDGPHTLTPQITTGAGDHFNAGFCLGLMLGFAPEESLKLGVLFSGYYVRTSESPPISIIPHFIQQLKAGT